MAIDFHEATKDMGIKLPQNMPSPDEMLERVYRLFPNLPHADAPVVKAGVPRPVLSIAASVPELWQKIALPDQPVEGVTYRKVSHGCAEHRLRRVSPVAIENATRSVWVSLDPSHGLGVSPRELQADGKLLPHLTAQAVLSLLALMPEWIYQWPKGAGMRLCGVRARYGHDEGRVPLVFVEERGIEHDLCFDAYIPDTVRRNGWSCPVVSKY